MAVSMGVMLSRSLNLCLGYTERLLKDVTADQFAKYAEVGGVTVASNHPAFILGHLSIYPPKIISQLGHDESLVSVPDGFEELFSHTSTCVNDPEGTIYPAMELITETYFQGYKTVLEKLESVDDALFQDPNPNEGRTRELFPTKGAMHTFYVSGHMMNHLGQFSAWRRMQGMGSA